MATQTLINADVDLDLKRKRSETSSVSELDTSRTKGIEAEGTTKEKQKKKKSKKAEINEDSDMADIKEIMKQWKQINTKLERLESKIEKAVLKGDGTIRSSIKDLMTEMKEDLLKSVTNRIEILEGKLFEKEESSEKLAQKVTALEEQLEKNKEETFRVNNQLDFEREKHRKFENESEQYSRINNIIIRGLPDTNPRETAEETLTKVQQYLQDKDIIELKASDVDMAHRLPNKKSQNRDVIVKLASRFNKMCIMRNRRNLRGTGVFVNDDLTQLNLHVLMCVKKKMIDEVSEAWFSRGKIFYKNSNGQVHLVKYEDYDHWIDLPWPFHK
ncbi:uncharacterized protein LOC128226317 [Mya arenaria]|uniref:uncharacterized protein LOC128221104 n=1 Tax=Mya arenaria TaxID=6604 RepID=UPI0022E86BEA|nr:uncharacterized protein LOC128221104 [Mya arenaria]XP_052785516.1 uncharacterized protein LOC128221104 [Mya arenaria]XP_052792161.1 uncharacterized protein LOC128226317 [Mya arenaria]